MTNKFFNGKFGLMKIKLSKRFSYALAIATLLTYASLIINFKSSQSIQLTCYQSGIATNESGGVYDINIQEKGWPVGITRSSEFSGIPKSCNAVPSANRLNEVGIVLDIGFWLMICELLILTSNYIRKNLTW